MPAAQLEFTSPALPAVTRKSRWHELFVTVDDHMTETTRRARWDAWLNLTNGANAEYWTDTSGCEGCIHLAGYWCTLVGLPCTVNPVLTFRHGMIGMACCGASKEIIGPTAPPSDDVPF